MAILLTAASLLMLMAGQLDAGAATFTYPKSDGCADVLLYGWNDDRDEVIVVTADRNALKLEVGTITLRLPADRDSLAVRVDLYATAPREVDYCTDVRRHDDPRPAATLHAISGELTITLGERGAVRREGYGHGRRAILPSMYEAEVILRDLVFEKPDGTSIQVRDPITLRAVVGYYWG